MTCRRQRTTLFPYTTLFRSHHVLGELDGMSRLSLNRENDLTGILGVIGLVVMRTDRKSTRLNSSHTVISYAVFCLKKKIGLILAAAGNKKIANTLNISQKNI